MLIGKVIRSKEDINNFIKAELANDPKSSAYSVDNWYVLVYISWGNLELKILTIFIEEMIIKEKYSFIFLAPDLMLSHLKNSLT